MGDRQAYLDPTPAEAIGNVQRELKKKKAINSCFASRKGKCSVLNVSKCDVSSCVFYKTEQQIQQERKLTFERIKSLDKGTQMHIAESYYGNKMPWLKEEI
jgi:hypothetical protein